VNAARAAPLDKGSAGLLVGAIAEAFMRRALVFIWSLWAVAAHGSDDLDALDALDALDVLDVLDVLDEGERRGAPNGAQGPASLLPALELRLDLPLAQRTTSPRFVDDEDLRAFVQLRWDLDGGFVPRTLPVASIDPVDASLDARDDDDVAALFAGEPTIAEVQAAAIAQARVADAVVDDLRARARAGAWLPRLTVATTGTLDRSRKSVHDLDGAAAVVQTRDDGQGARLVVGAAWDLSRAVFDPAEVALQREAVRLALWRERLVDDVTHRFFERRRAALALALSPPRDPRERRRHEEQLAELTAELDGRTGNLFHDRTPRSLK
jgi:hypothetical protein